jgi:hypothetical protein
MKSILISTFADLLFVTLCAFPCTSSAEKDPMLGFPSEFKFSELWEKLVIDGKPTRAYRFVANESIDDVKVKVSRWLQHSQVPVVESSKNGWTYLSYRNEDAWITVQVRPFAHVGSSKVEGLVSFWQVSYQRVVRSIEPRLSTLSSMQVLRRLESVDRGRNAITVTAISDASIEVVANGLAADMRTHGYVPVSYAPPSLLSSDKAANLYGAVSRAWIGNGQQVLFSVFEHRGKTAAQIYVLGGKHVE